MNAATGQVGATKIDYEYAIKEEDVILDLWSDNPLSDLQLAVLQREAVRGPLEPKYVTQSDKYENGYVYILSWNCHDQQLAFKFKQLIRHVLDAHH